MRILLLLLLPAAVIAGEPRIISTGWNRPTARQFARDAALNAGLPMTGTSVGVCVRGAATSNPFRAAHGADPWVGVSFEAPAAVLAGADAGPWRDVFLTVNANPGDVDWLDDNGWAAVVEHWRSAARLARRGGLRGILFDPEPYAKPHRQFDYRRQAGAADAPFADYEAAARRRGGEVMAAVVEEFPDVEILSYFLTSYLVRDDRYRGPSPLSEGEPGEGTLRRDANRQLANHAYGLLPAFLDGWLDEARPGVRLVDGCENAYWHESRAAFFAEAADVRGRGRLLVSSENRAKYDAQVAVGFGLFVDAFHPDLVGRWTLEPGRADRLTLLRRNLGAAIDAGDGLVWLYGEHGRWWPPPGETAAWKGKDVYPPWEEVLPGVTAAIAETVAGGDRPTPTDAEIAAARAEPTRPATRPAGTVRWQTWTRPDTPGTVSQSEDGAMLAGVSDGAALASVPVRPGQTVRAAVRVRQTGRGLASVSLRWRDAEGRWITGGDADRVVYPADGAPGEARPVVAEGVAPEGAAFAVAGLNAGGQFDDGRAEFEGLRMTTGE